MKLLHPLEAVDAEEEFNKLFIKYDKYIHTLAYKCIVRECPLLERDDLIQRSYIKLWQALKKQHIEHPRSYIAHVVDSVYVDMLRERKISFPLTLNEESELLKGTALVLLSEGMDDPQDELERKEASFELLDMLSSFVVRLPQRQKHAMLLRLEKRVDNLASLTTSLRKYKVAIEKVYHPVDHARKQSLASSVAPALTKFEAYLEKRSTR